MPEHGLSPASPWRIAERDDDAPTLTTLQGPAAMAKNHGAKDQKRTAKQKAKRQAKRSALFERESNDPTIRLQRAEKWPVVQSVVGDQLWKQGIGHVLIARREPVGGLVFAVFLVDVYCLGVKNAFWRAGTPSDIEDVIRKMEKFEKMLAVTPACLSKIVKGAVEYAHSFGFPPHPDYRHASMLLEGIHSPTCPSEFKFGKDGLPFYVQGPNESPAQAAAIMQRVQGTGEHYIMSLSNNDVAESIELGPEIDRFEMFEEES
jgi:hypothetical protein